MKKWTKEEIELLKKHYSTSTLDELFKLFPGRSERSIRVKANKLGLSKTTETRSLIASKTNKERKNKVWTDEEIEILKKYYPRYGAKWVHENYLPHRAIHSILFKANSLGIKREDREPNWIRTEENINTKSITQSFQVVYKKVD